MECELFYINLLTLVMSTEFYYSNTSRFLCRAIKFRGRFVLWSSRDQISARWPAILIVVLRGFSRSFQ